MRETALFMMNAITSCSCRIIGHKKIERKTSLEFARLARTFEQLENTRSRLALITLLAELFQAVDSPDEIAHISYLIQGRVTPSFEALEFGMAEKSVVKALALAYHTTPENALALYRARGDLGLVAEQLSHSRGTIPLGLGVEDVFEALKGIAEILGKGAVEKRLALLVDVLKTVDGVTAKYIVRMLLGTLRLGIGDATLLDALATAKFHDPKQRKLLEGGYHKTSDLGLIAKTLWQHPSMDEAQHAVESLDVQVGKPIRPEFAERLPDAETIIQKNGSGRCSI